MRFIEEVVVDEFLPTVRSMLAEDLRDRGFTQSEVADALGISQSAVSKYAAGDVARHEDIVADERVRDLVKRVGEGLANGDLTPVAALVEIEVLIRQLEEGDLLADLHEAAMPALADADVEFSVHDPDSGLRERERVLTSVRRGLRTLTNASGFAGLIPNVGANVAECTADAATVDDVAAVPGRLVDVKGRAMVPGEPEFGVSEHVATVLLAAREAGADVRGAVNLRYDPETVEALAADRPTVEFDAERPTRKAVAAAVAAADLPAGEGTETLVVYQTGAVGVEPIIYVLAQTAAEAARIVRGLL
ncbi:MULTISPECIES: thiamine-phosphate synthase family protein [Halorubrum]|uniref:HTH cro/C1-type domain-containing protein n=1 Tax=Halorubrum sodomense TaxID=35743 RepID=A0A1I6G596_HALSD|nr:MULTISPECIES: thiamine-phosphate synthase family protein [Halorubrum]TKX67483.1 helix-turn-helix domain-containing protein [Halorubrum sp. SP9]SFR37393.1 hypothetical protein SAMN04487937_1641 [Halorubrum sodomense]